MALDALFNSMSPRDNLVLIGSLVADQELATRMRTAAGETPIRILRVRVIV